MKNYPGINFSLIDEPLNRKFWGIADYYLRELTRATAKTIANVNEPGLGDLPNLGDALPNFLFLPGRVHGQTLVWSDTSASAFSINTNRFSTALEIARSVFDIHTRDLVNILSVGDNGAVVINVPYSTYTSGNPVGLTVQMLDTTTFPGTFIRFKTALADIFTIGYTGAVNIVPNALTTGLTLKAFSTSASNVYIDFLSSSGGTPIGRIGLGNATARLALGTNVVNNAMVNVVPPSAAASTLIPGFRMVFTDTGASAGADNGLIRLAPTLSDAVNGVAAGFVQRIDAIVNNAVGDWNGLEFNMQIEEYDALTGGGTLSARAIHFEARSIGTGTLSALRGFQGGGNHQATGTLVDGVGGSYYFIQGAAAGAITNADILICLGGSSTIGGTVTNLSSLRIQNPTITGTVTNNFGIKIEDRSGGTNVWSLWAGTGNSSIAGNLRLGDHTAPTAQLSFADAKNMEFGTGTGTKIATAAAQKISFWNAAPIVQPTVAIAAAVFVANTSGIVNDSATFDGYTIGQVVKALRNAGLLA